MSGMTATSLEVPTAKALNRDRRTRARFPCILRMSFQLVDLGGGACWSAVSQNLSTGGIALVLGRRFEPGTLLTLRLRGQSGGVSYTLLARVVRVTPHPRGGWILGCVFAQKLREEEVQDLVREAEDVSSRLRRRLCEILQADSAVSARPRIPLVPSTKSPAADRKLLTTPATSRQRTPPQAEGGVLLLTTRYQPAPRPIHGS